MKPLRPTANNLPAILLSIGMAGLPVHASAQTTWINCHEGTVETLYKEGDVHIYALKVEGFSQGEAKSNPLANSKYVCDGVFNAGRGANTGTIFCRFDNPDGDIVFSEITADGQPKSRFRLIGGTGKWAKATGEGRLALTFTSKKVEDGPFKACVRGEGSLKLQ